MKILTKSKVLKDRNIPLLLFSLVYYVIIIYLSNHLNVWEDEIYSLNTSSEGLRYAFNQSLHFEVQPPVYYLLLSLWRSISDSILWARILSVVLIILSQVVLYKFTEKVTNRKIPTMISIIFLLNPWTVFSILEIRLYALIIFLSLAIIVSFYNTYYINNVNLTNRVIYIILAIASIFTQYFIGFLLAANAVVLLIQKNKRPLRFYLMDMIIPLCLVLLYIPLIRLSVNVQTAIVPEYSRTLGEFIAEARGFVTQMAFDYLLPSNLFYPGKITLVLRSVLILLIFFGLFQTGILKGLRAILPFLIINVIIIIFFVLVLYIFGKYSTDFKYAFVLLGPLYITLAFLLQRFKPKMFYVLLIYLLIFYTIWDYNRYKGLYKVKEYKALCENVEKNEVDGEPLFVYRNISAEVIKIYYSGINKIIPLPREFVYDQGYGTYLWEIEKNDLDELTNKLQIINGFYLAVDKSPLAGFDEEKKILMDYFSDKFAIVREEQFKGQLFLYKFSKKESPYDKID